MRVCFLENCFFELFLGIKSGYRPVDLRASSYFFDSDQEEVAGRFMRGC